MNRAEELARHFEGGRCCTRGTPCPYAAGLAADRVHNVRIGQVWEDNDPRCAGRRLHVDAIVTVQAVRQVGYRRRKVSVEYAECTIVNPTKHARGTRRRTTRIETKRFRPNAKRFRLVEDAADA